MAADSLQFSKQSGRLTLWIGPLIAPLAWLIDLQVSFSGNRQACDSNSSTILHLATAVTFLIALAGVWLTWSNWRKTGEKWPGEEEGIIGRSRFLAFVGLWVNLIFLAAILAQAVPKWMLSACQ